ncbi:hypothetical protein CL618_02780 [archaeon]|nr:hypothetical protein [archaeon]|tara:strand:- start:1383 stop:1832 length:450 start_codon:yes stop_codon:yes gene_type:complete
MSGYPRDFEELLGSRFESYLKPPIMNLRLIPTNYNFDKLKDCIDSHAEIEEPPIIFDEFLDLVRKHQISGNYFLVEDGNFFPGSRNVETRIALIDHCYINSLALLELERIRRTKHLHAHAKGVRLIFSIESCVGGIVTDPENTMFIYDD